MKSNKGPNWQGILVMVGVLVWTLSNIDKKLARPELGMSWWAAMAPAGIFLSITALLYLVARLSIWINGSSKGVR